MYLLHCSPLWLCKNIFKVKGLVTKLGSLRLFLEREEVCASGCPLGNESSHCFFPPNHFGHWSCFNTTRSKKNTNHFPLLHALPINSTGMFQAPALCQAFSSEWNKTVLALAAYQERQSGTVSTWGRNSVRSTMETQWKELPAESRHEKGERAWL